MNSKTIMGYSERWSC